MYVWSAQAYFWDGNERKGIQRQAASRNPTLTPIKHCCTVLCCARTPPMYHPQTPPRHETWPPVTDNPCQHIAYHSPSPPQSTASAPSCCAHTSSSEPALDLNLQPSTHTYFINFILMKIKLINFINMTAGLGSQPFNLNMTAKTEPPSTAKTASMRTLRRAKNLSHFLPQVAHLHRALLALHLVVHTPQAFQPALDLNLQPSTE